MDLRDYFRMRCSQMLLFIRDLDRLNSQMIQETQYQKLAEAFRWQQQQLSEQQSLLAEVVDNLGGQSGPEENPLSQALIRTHTHLVNQKPTWQLAAIGDAQEARTVTEITIALYRELLDLGRQLNGQRHAIERLERCQSDAERYRARLEDLIRPLITEMSGEMRRAA